MKLPIGADGPEILKEINQITDKSILRILYLILFQKQLIVALKISQNQK